MKGYSRSRQIVRGIKLYVKCEIIKQNQTQPESHFTKQIKGEVILCHNSIFNFSYSFYQKLSALLSLSFD